VKSGFGGLNVGKLLFGRIQMAQFERINFNGVEVTGINIRKIVGYAGANLVEDVMLIQTVFEYISKGIGPHVFGMEHQFKADFPGRLDNDTVYALGEFQIKNASRLLKDTYRRIHPASYRGRVISAAGKPLMTITYLHMIAVDAEVMQGHASYTEELIKMQPELAFFTDKALIES
jgi:hypothetical protein